MHDPMQGGVVYGSANYTIELLDYLIEPNTIHVSALGTKEENGTCNRVSISMIMDDVLINSTISMKGDTKKTSHFLFHKMAILKFLYIGKHENIVSSSKIISSVSSIHAAMK